MTGETETQPLAEEVRQLRADFSRIADALHEIIRRCGGEAAGNAEDVAQRLFEEVRRRKDGLAREIEQKPLTAALGAFGIGVVVGALFKARRG